MRDKTVLSLLARVLALACVLPLQACATTYSAEPIEAWVMDAETGQPVEGVVVTANWELEIGTVGGNVPVGQIMVMEAVTDQMGRLYFPAWGPKTVPPEMPNPMKSPPHLVNRDPQLVLFKSGYKWLELANYPLSDCNKSSLRKSDWNGKTIRMEKFKGDLKEYASYLSFLRTPMKFVEEDCNWKKPPRMILAVDQQYQLFRKSGIDTGLHIIDSLEGISRSIGQKCGSAREFFERVQK